MTHLFMLHCTCCMISCHKNAAHVLPPNSITQWDKSPSEFVSIFKDRPFKILASDDSVLLAKWMKPSGELIQHTHMMLL